MTPKIAEQSNCAVIVAHPDDETLWSGGTILMNPANEWTIAATCRKSDPDRNPKFYKAVRLLHATGYMGDLDDGPDQMPLAPETVESEILSLLPDRTFDLIITHSLHGEYTRHRRHEEVAAAVVALLESGRVKTSTLWMFAYEDGNRHYLPKPINHADLRVNIPQDIWSRKYHMITETYGFPEDGWEAKTTPVTEAFWVFNSVDEIRKLTIERIDKNESTRPI